MKKLLGIGLVAFASSVFAADYVASFRSGTTSAAWSTRDAQMDISAGATTNAVAIVNETGSAVTLAMDAAITLPATKPSLTISANAGLAITDSGSYLKNNTIASLTVNGGTKESPILIDEQLAKNCKLANAGTIGSDTYFKEKGTGNRDYIFTGAGAGSSHFIVDSSAAWGQSGDTGSKLRDLTFSVVGDKKFWWESTQMTDASVDVNLQTTGHVKLSPKSGKSSVTVGSLSGSAAIEGSGNTIVVNMHGTDAEYTSDTIEPTLEVNGTGCLYLNPSADASGYTLTGSGTVRLGEHVTYAFGAIRSSLTLDKNTTGKVSFQMTAAETSAKYAAFIKFNGTAEDLAGLVEKGCLTITDSEGAKVTDDITVEDATIVYSVNGETKTWTDGDNLSLALKDSLYFETETIVGAGSISGYGTIYVTSKVTLTNNLYAVRPFADFHGKIVIGEGGYIDCQNKAEGTWAESVNPLGGATVVFEGGVIHGFKQGNNVKTFSPIVVETGKTGYITNNVDYSTWSGHGVNLTLSGDISGAGDLFVAGQMRWTRLDGDNSDFTGNFTYTNLTADTQYAGFVFGKASAGSADAAFFVDNPATVTFDTATSETLELGAFIESDRVPANKMANESIIQIGGKEDVDSYITAPFVNKKVTINKIGAQTLTLGERVDAVAGSIVNVEAGTLVVNGDTTNLVVSVKSGATLTGKGKVRVKAIEAGATITGSINIVFAGDQDALYYNMDQVPFDDSFTGSVIITNGTKVTWQGTSFEDDTNTSIFGKNPTLVLAGGCLKGFENSNNQLLTGTIQVVDGTGNAITNDAAHFMNGVNLSCQAALKGKGSLEFHQKDRWLKFSGSNANFGGDVRITGASSVNPNASSTDDANGTYFQSAASGSAAASWTHDRKAWLKLQQPANATIKFGALNITTNTPATYIDQTGTTVEIGGNNDDSAINNPFLGNAFTLKKVGYGSLTFAETVTFQTGTTFAVAPAADDVTGPGDPTGVEGAVKEYTLLTLPSGSTATVTQPTGDTWASRRGKWRVVSDTVDSTTTYKLVWSPNGLMIIVR